MKIEAGQDWLWGTATWTGHWVEITELSCRMCPHGLYPPLVVPHTNSLWYWKNPRVQRNIHWKKEQPPNFLPPTNSLTIPSWWVLLQLQQKAKKCLCLWLFRFLKVKQVTGCTSLCTQMALGSLTGCTSMFAVPRAWQLLFWDLAQWFGADDVVQHPILPPHSRTCSWDTVRGTLGHPTHLLYRENMFWIVWVRRGEKTSSTLFWLDSASQLLVLTVFSPHLSFAPFN